MSLSLSPIPFVSSAPQTTAEFRSHASLSSGPSFSQSNGVTPGLYWFQVGVWASNAGGYGNEFGIPVTGASVEIRVKNNQQVLDPKSDLSYWVGLNLPGDSFIQVGYKIEPDNEYAQWFWEYFKPGTASEGDARFLGQAGENNIGPNGTWYKFSLTESGTRWYAYVNSAQVGSVDLGVTDSGTNGPFASAEVASTKNAQQVLGPVEFRNLEYRDLSGAWWQASEAQSLCCYSAGSDTYGGNYSYGVESVPGENNYWLAGSNLPSPIQEEGDYLWPWYHITIQDFQNMTTSTAWYVYGSTVDLTEAPSTVQVSPDVRFQLNGWYVNGELGIPTSFITQGPITEVVLRPQYLKQYLVTVSSTTGSIVEGSGWYTSGSYDTIFVTPTILPYPNSFGLLNSHFVRWMGSFTSTNSNDRFKVDGPMTIEAIWAVDPFSPLILLALILLFAVLAIGSIVALRKRKTARK
jgi:hypothetical protein